jgi:hypothetical protein
VVLFLNFIKELLRWNTSPSVARTTNFSLLNKTLNLEKDKRVTWTKREREREREREKETRNKGQN